MKSQDSQLYRPICFAVRVKKWKTIFLDLSKTVSFTPKSIRSFDGSSINDVIHFFGQLTPCQYSLWLMYCRKTSLPFKNVTSFLDDPFFIKFHQKVLPYLSGFPAPIRWRSDENVLSGSYNNKQRINGSSNGLNGSESDNEGINNNNNKHDHGATMGMWRNKKQKWVKKMLS